MNEPTQSNLLAACIFGDIASVHSLVERGVSVNTSDGSGALPLTLAVQLGHYKLVEALLDLGAQVNSVDRSSNITALHVACMRGDIAIIKLLVDRGALVNVQDQCGGVPALHSLSFKGNTEAVKFLLDHGAEVNLKDATNGQTALFQACFQGRTETIKILLDHGADVDLCNILGVSPLMTACSRGHTGIAKLLLDHGAELDLCNDEGIPASYSASKYGHTETLKLLLDRGAKVDVQDNTGKTALIIASACGHTETIKVLLDHGCQVNTRENSGLTALIRAGLSGHAETVKVLLDHGAEAYSKDVPLSALNVISWTDKSDVLQLLIEHSSKAYPIAAKQAQENHKKALQLSLISEKGDDNSARNQNIEPYFQVQEIVKSQDKQISEIQPRIASSGDSMSQHTENLSLAKAFRELLPQASNWQKIGTWLNLSTDVLAKIGDLNQNRVRDCLREVLEEWLKEIDPVPTWEQLVHAMRQMDQEKAEEMERKYCK